MRTASAGIIRNEIKKWVKLPLTKNLVRTAGGGTAVFGDINLQALSAGVEVKWAQERTEWG